MVYTSGIRLSEDDTLVQMQYQKIDLVCQKIQLKQGERLLDIGCGWGSFTLQATKNYGVRVPSPLHVCVCVCARTRQRLWCRRECVCCVCSCVMLRVCVCVCRRWRLASPSPRSR